MSIKTDVLIIGGGPGGYVAAIKLGQLGKRSIVVDRDKLGGECLNYGCIPSKALISAANTRHKSKKAMEAGFEDGSSAKIDWDKVVAWKDQMIGGFVKNIGVLVKGNRSEFMNGLARFTSNHTAIVEKAGGGTETIEFDQAIVATGSAPVGIPGFAVDGVNILSSKEALDLKKAPDAMVVVGGGVIGLEIGTLFAKLGTKVTVVEFTDGILPVIERDMSTIVSRSLAKLALGARHRCGGREGRGARLRVPSGRGA